MEHEIVRKQVSGHKRTLTVLAGSSALIGVIAAVVRAIAGSQIQDYTHPLIGLLGIGMILSLFVALLALNTRLQVAFDESGYEPAIENEQK
jgi:multisubunit Na+/H+ antiporter MnhF subunit